MKQQKQDTYTFHVSEQEQGFVCSVAELGIVAYGSTKKEAFDAAVRAAEQEFIRRSNEAFLVAERAQASA